MPSEIPPDTKFAAIHLANCWCGELSNSLVLDNELSVRTSPVMTLTEMDERRIGSDYAKAFAESNLVLVASRVSQTPGVLDDESLELEGRVYMLLYAVFTLGVPNFWPGVLTLGSKPGDQDPWANRIVLVNEFRRHRDVVPPQVTVESLQEAGRLTLGFMEIFEKDQQGFGRVRRGVNRLIRGWKAQSALDRLHAFVQALDGLMKLERGSGERQFAERLAVIATAEQLHPTALELYRLRSHEEHLSDWPSTLSYVKQAERAEFVSRRSFQAEILAGNAYRTLLSNADLRGEFHDSRVDAFWEKPAKWKTRVDIDAYDSRYRYQGEG